MRKAVLFLITPLILTLGFRAEAKTQVLITGQDAQEVQENAFEQRMNYPVSPLKCNQRCSQWWER